MLELVLGISIPFCVIIFHICLFFAILKYRKNSGLNKFDNETLLTFTIAYFLIGSLVAPVHFVTILATKYQEQPLKVETPIIYQEAGYRDSAKV